MQRVTVPCRSCEFKAKFDFVEMQKLVMKFELPERKLIYYYY